jgi:predicted MFS family arabinose efflux permease
VIVGVIVMRAYPGRAGLANAVAISGMSVGQLLMISMLAAVLVQIGWRAVFVWIGAAHLVLLPFLFTLPGQGATTRAAAAAAPGLSLSAAARTRQFWLLIVIYAICGMDDFFVTTHVAAFAQDRGLGPLLAGNLLAFMGLTGLAGVIAAGAASDRLGPAWPTAASFAARIAVFGWIAIDQSPLSIAIFALVFGATFLITAPLTVVFVRESFGTRHLGAIAGLITMVHQIFGGVGAYLGAAIFDATGGYESAFIAMLVSAVVALALTLMLRTGTAAEPPKSS